MRCNLLLVEFIICFVSANLVAFSKDSLIRSLQSLYVKPQSLLSGSISGVNLNTAEQHGSSFFGLQGNYSLDNTNLVLSVFLVIAIVTGSVAWYRFLKKPRSLFVDDRDDAPGSVVRNVSHSNVEDVPISPFQPALMRNSNSNLIGKFKEGIQYLAFKFNVATKKFLTDLDRCLHKPFDNKIALCGKNGNLLNPDENGSLVFNNEECHYVRCPICSGHPFLPVVDESGIRGACKDCGFDPVNNFPGCNQMAHYKAFLKVIEDNGAFSVFTNSLISLLETTSSKAPDSSTVWKGVDAVEEAYKRLLGSKYWNDFVRLLSPKDKFKDSNQYNGTTALDYVLGWIDSFNQFISQVEAAGEDFKVFRASKQQPASQVAFSVIAESAGQPAPEQSSPGRRLNQAGSKRLLTNEELNAARLAKLTSNSVSTGPAWSAPIVHRDSSPKPQTQPLVYVPPKGAERFETTKAINWVLNGRVIHSEPKK